MRQSKDDQRRAKVWRAVRPLMEKLGLYQTFGWGFKFVKTIESGPQNKDRLPCATVDNQYPYRRIVITLTRDFVDGADPQQLRAVVLHEAIHEAVFGWVRHYYTIGDQQINAEENHVTLLEEWLLDNVKL